MDIALGVSMTPMTVRMVLVEGENADGPTVDHDAFDIVTSNASDTVQDQVLAAILGTRESAAEGSHRLVSTGVAWSDHNAAAALRKALAERGIDDVLLVSESHAAANLAKAAGSAVGYQRTALMFLERDTATLSVVDTADGTIVKVQHQDLHTEDAVAELGTMLAGLEELPAPPQGIFVVGSGVSVAAIKSELAAATSLPLNAPEEPELALARGAALAAVAAPMFEASTVGLAYSQHADEGPTAGALAYSDVEPESGAEVERVIAGAAPVPPGRKPFLLVGSALTGTFVVGVAALVISLAVSIRPTVDQRPTPGESMIVPTQAPAPVAAVPPAPAPAPPPETIPAPVPVVQEAPAPAAPPRTVFVEAPAAPAPVAPAPAAPPPDPVPQAPPPVMAPVIPAPIISVPQPLIPVIRMPWDPPVRQQWPGQQAPLQQWPGQQWPGQQQWPQQQWPQQDNDEPTWDPPGRRSHGGRAGSDGNGSGGGNNSIWPWPIFGGGH